MNASCAFSALFLDPDGTWKPAIVTSVDDDGKADIIAFCETAGVPKGGHGEQVGAWYLFRDVPPFEITSPRPVSWRRAK